MEMFGLTDSEIQEMQRKRAAGPKRAPGPLSEEELYDAIFAEIQERWDFLEEMKRGGAGAQHEGRTRAEARSHPRRGEHMFRPDCWRWRCETAAGVSLLAALHCCQEAMHARSRVLCLSSVAPCRWRRG